MPKLIPKPKFITFDRYGTLVQWHSALLTGVRAVLAKHVEVIGMEKAQVTETVEALRTLSMEQQQRPPYRHYKTILQSSLAEVMAGKKLSPQPSDGETLLSYLRTISPHPEVPAVLQRFRTQFRLAIISNTDDDLIAGTVAAIGVPIDYVITAQHAQAYKPDHRLFLYAHSVMGVAPEETVHVGMGQVTDLKVCHELGIRAVWIDRLGETLNPDWTPEAVLPDLSGLPELLA
jgi:2-haloacid dehalogenase